MVVGALLLVHVVSCCGDDGSCIGSGSGVGAAASCQNGDVSYTSAGERKTHVCPNKDCRIDASTGSATCDSGPGMFPFRTCQSAADCVGAKYCPTEGIGLEFLLTEPVCTDGVCGWMNLMDQFCADGRLCYGGGCEGG